MFRESCHPLSDFELAVSNSTNFRRYACGRNFTQPLGFGSKQAPDLQAWRWMVSELERKNQNSHWFGGEVWELHDAYISVREALRHALPCMLAWMWKSNGFRQPT